MPKRPVPGNVVRANSFLSTMTKDETRLGRLVSPIASPIESKAVSSQSTNQNLGKLYLNKLQPKDTTEEVSLLDFMIAIFYVLFGTMALIAGIVSILSE